MTKSAAARGSERAVLVVGADGRIGRAVMQRLTRAGVFTLGTTRRDTETDPSRLCFDLAEALDGWRCPFPVAAAVIAAGVTGLEGCERDPSGTARVNVAATLALARSLTDSDAFVVFLSSNQVFDGTWPRRAAGDPRSPRTEYGRQKAAVEERLLAESGGSAAVVRLTKVLPAGFPLLRGWADDLKAGNPVRPFCDMVMAPVPIGFVAEGIARVVEARVPGIIQVSGERDVTYAEAAVRLANRLGADQGLVRPQATGDVGLHCAFAPAYTTLDTTRLSDELHLCPPDVWSTIDGSFAV
jgi:dTDP-4-dehydrorhamnose reductase